MSKLFGTDGVRGVANAEPMTCSTVQRLGAAVASMVAGRIRNSPKIIIGKDTRLSGYMFESAFASGVVAAGGRALLTGPLPTPGIAFLTWSMRCDAGIVISASHNPYQDNGVKIFGPDGYKLDDATEAKIEDFVTSGSWQESFAEPHSIGYARRLEDSVGRYIVWCKSAFPEDLTLGGLKVVIDTANGAAYKAAPLVFKELGAQVVAIHASPDGKNINENCGALYPQELARQVLDHKADFGVALDGDADRLIVVDETGQVVDGDEVLAICGLDMMTRDELAYKTIVATVMSNIGLESALKRLGGKLLRTQVGDRNVVEAMRKGGFVLGGEQSGHLVFGNHGTTGDGIVAALRLAAVLIRQQRKLSEARDCIERAPQVLKSVVVADKRPFEELVEVTALIEDVQRKLADSGRVLVRYSGTEAKARVMIEGPDEAKLSAWADEIAGALKAACGGNS